MVEDWVGVLVVLKVEQKGLQMAPLMADLMVV
jgi:hypothetical protein